jgi:hypothetical protein
MRSCRKVALSGLAFWATALRGARALVFGVRALFDVRLGRGGLGMKVD